MPPHPPRPLNPTHARRPRPAGRFSHWRGLEVIPLRILTVTLLAALAMPVAALPPLPPTVTLCRVQVTSDPHPLGRLLTVRLRPDCPPGSVARVRLDSRWGGSQPDDPPGAYTLRPGQTLQRMALPWWWLSWIDRSGRTWRVMEPE